jgi:hypothetical protein
MAKWQLKNIRSLTIAAHRDFGYFFSVLIIVYCLSGIALNHVNDWNSDFIIQRDSVPITKEYRTDELNKKETILELGKLVGQDSYKVYDFPTPDQVKIYYDNASLHVNFTFQSAIYEQVARRPLFYQVNVLHRNSLKEWKWAADIFAVMLIVINLTGIFMLKGKYGISGRGKWLIAAGTIPPVVAIIVFYFS